MKITNLTKLIIRFLGGGKIDFPTKNLKEVEIEPFDSEGGGENDGEGEEAMDFKTYCDTIIRNYLSDIGTPVESVVMPDEYAQYSVSDDKFIIGGDYLKPYFPIKCLYNDTLVIDENKTYICGIPNVISNIISENILVPGNKAVKNNSIPVENYCSIINNFE